jgi:hypothetical protein
VPVTVFMHDPLFILIYWVCRGRWHFTIAFIIVRFSQSNMLGAKACRVGLKIESART